MKMKTLAKPTVTKKQKEANNWFNSPYSVEVKTNVGY